MNTHFFKRLLLVVPMCYSCSLLALPTDSQVVSGQVNLDSTKKDQLQITTGHQSIINWGNFSVGTQEKVEFVQPSSTSTVLNRVTGNAPSQILGQIYANGKVYLINKSGIIFGKDSVVETGSFFSSTYDIADTAFLSGEDTLFKGESQSTIINYGTIKALDGNITLIGRSLDNQGTITAHEGEISLAAGREILMKFEDLSILTIRPSLDPDGLISHSGELEALVVNLQSEGRAYAHGMNIKGRVRALNTVKENGKIYLRSNNTLITSSGELESENGAISIENTGGKLCIDGNICAKEGSISITSTAPDSLVFNQGKLDVSGTDSSGHIQIDATKLINTGSILAKSSRSNGGEISIHTEGLYIETNQATLSVDGLKRGGDISLCSGTTLFSSGALSSQGEVGGQISLFAPLITLMSANLNASGTSLGGDISIGQDVLSTTYGKSVHIGGDTSISACSTRNGNGGSVGIWSDEKTVCHGTILANAGYSGGHGGSIEVSSEGTLYCAATLSANAPYGNPGTALIDPKNIIIDAGGGTFPQYEFIDPNSGGGSQFGNVTVLTNGNVVITKRLDDAGGSGAGAAYLYNGATAALISTLIGSQANDNVGIGGATALTNGNYVIESSDWANGAAADAGAATWGSGTTGVSGVVSSSNSLVGSQANDSIGINVIALTNGNYVTSSLVWDNGGASSAGAVTWGDGTTGITGVVSSSNSLVGTSASDSVGTVTALTNGNYVVTSPSWDDGFGNVGAATWCDGTTGRTGAVTTSNSLYGGSANDNVGDNAVIALTNGNYVVLSSGWNNGGFDNAGAATWCDGTTGRTGLVSTSNSLYGTAAENRVGADGIALTNGNYVVVSTGWDDGATANVGAATWGNGTTGTTGAVSSSNSLVGVSASDQIGANAVALTNGNYVISSAIWDNGGISNAGASVWCDGTTGRTGTVTTSNSLYGNQTEDRVGNSIIPLTNGNYVVSSPFWNAAGGGPTDVGAVTWVDGTTGLVAAVSSSNSLIGSQTSDRVGTSGVQALTNGNYIVQSGNWDNGAISNAGAVTWCDGTTGRTGLVSTSNSLYGTQASDFVGFVPGAVLTNGNFVARSYLWDNGGVSNAGAVTWMDGTTGLVGAVSSSNSLVGTQANDQVGNSAVVALSGGNYVVKSTNWDDGGISNAGAATWGSGTSGITGTINTVNSLIGQNASAGLQTPVDDPVNGTFVVSFRTEGASGVVRAGYNGPSALTYEASPSATVTIAPTFVEESLNGGTNVTLEANNDLTVSSSITTTGTGALTLRSGRTSLIDADITLDNGDLTVIANDLLSNGVVDSDRDAGDATLTLSDGITIDTGTGNITLSLLDGAGKTNTGSSNVVLGDNVTLQCSGSGAISITAQENNITFGTGSLLQAVNGDVTLTAGIDISTADPLTIETTGTGELFLISDNLFPTTPLFGSGKIDLAQATLTTNGGRLLLYTAERDLNTMPATINSVAYTPGTEFVDTATEKWGTYYPDSSGIPFTIFYKETGSPPSTASTTGISQKTKNDALYAMITALVEPFRRWRAWYRDIFFSGNRAAPYLTQTQPHLKSPSLVNQEKEQALVMQK